MWNFHWLFLIKAVDYMDDVDFVDEVLIAKGAKKF